MKKTNIFAAVASLALLAGMFTGCVTDNPDLEAVGNLDGYYVRGELYEDGWNIKDDSNKLVADTEKGSVGFYYAKFKALGESGTWKIANGDWTSQFNQKAGNMTIGTLPEGVKNEQVDDGNGGLNEKLVGLKTGQWYKINVIATATAVEVSLEESEGTAEAVPVPYYLDGYAVRSLDTAWNVTADNLLYNPTEDKTTGNLTYKLDFVASATGQQLAIARKEWSEGRWECSEAKSFAVGAEPISLESGKEQHPTVTGLTVGNSYRIYVYTTPNKEVSMKVVALTSVKVTPTVSVSGLPEALNGATLYFTGDFNDWKEPGKSGSIECKVAGGAVSVTLPEVSKAFEPEEEKSFSYSGKFASAGWARPEITNDAGKNISFKVTSDKYTVKGTFKTTKEHKDGGTQYLCDWTVE